MSSAVSLDLRRVPSHEHYLRALVHFERLAPDATLELVSDHDLLLVQRQLQAEVAGQFAWTAVESGPEAWRVHLTRLARRDHCCGGCCGG